MAECTGHSVQVPVVLAHGWGGSYATTWAGSALETNLRRAGREIVEIDLPGHGRAGLSHEPSDYEFIARQLGELLPVGRTVDAVGFSLGGKLLLQLAAEQPWRFRRLVVAGVGANLFRPEDGDAASSELLEGPRDETPPTLRAVVEEAILSGNDRRALSAVIRRPPQNLTRDDLASVTAELLLAVGDHDTVSGPLGPLAAALPGARTAVLNDLDHVATPGSQQFTELASEFLSAR